MVATLTLTIAFLSISQDKPKSGMRKRSAAAQQRRKERGIARGILLESEKEKELKEAVAASQRQVAVERAAAARAEQQRQWAVKAAAADHMTLLYTERELKETEDVALFALGAYQRADKQRTELYYQAKTSNALAAKTLIESLGAGNETVKALAKQRKVQVVEQAKAIRLTVKPHLTAAVQGHTPLPHLPKGL